LNLIQVEKFLNGREIDFLFIDGDHTEDGVTRDFFLYNGVDIHPDLVIAINDPKFNYSGNIAERKQKAISDIIDSGYTNLTFFDDNDENLRLAMDVNGYMGAKIKLVKVD
jgi:hypothetical protein